MAKKAKKPVEVVVVLDRSGSMSCCRNETITGFNEFLNTQKEIEGDVWLTLNQFDDVFENVYTEKKIKNAPELTEETYVPRNMTALLDAIGKTINETETRLKRKRNKRSVIFLIMTDGFENASQEFKGKDIEKLIKEKRKKKNGAWQFMFMGSNQDAIVSAHNYGFSASGSFTYDTNIAGGSISAYSIVSDTISAAIVSGSDCMFKLSDREEYDNSFGTDNMKHFTPKK